MWSEVLAVVGWVLVGILLLVIGAHCQQHTSLKILQRVEQVTKRASADVRYAMQRELDAKREATEFKDDATERISQLENEVEENQTVVAELRELVKTRAAELEALEDRVQDQDEKRASEAATARHTPDLIDPRILTLRSRLTRLSGLVLDQRGKSAKAVSNFFLNSRISSITALSCPLKSFDSPSTISATCSLLTISII